MLKITINDQQVDLEGVKFSLQLNSPIPFNPEDNQQEGSFAFGVTFPATAANKKIFGFPHRLEQYPAPQKDFPGLMYFAGRLLFKVVISLTDSSDFSYRGNVKVDLGYYTSMIGEKTLRDLEYEGVQTIGTTTQDVVDHANYVASKQWPEVNYNFPEHYNPKFYGDENEMNPTYQGLVNFYIHGNGFRKNVVDNDNEVRNYYNLCPWPYLFYVLQHCYSEFGFSVTGPVLKNTQLQKLLIYNNYALDLQEDRYKSVVELSADQSIAAEETLLQFDDVTTNIDNCYDAVLYKYLITKSGDHRITGHIRAQAIDTFGAGYTCLCEVTLYKNDVEVEKIMGDNAVGAPYNYEFDLEYTCFVDVLEIGQYLSLKVQFIMAPGFMSYYAPGTLFAESWWGCQNITWSSLNIYAKSINIQNHVPDIKISAFLITLMKTFGIIHQFNSSSSTVQLLFLGDVLASAEEEPLTEFSVKSSKLAGFNQGKAYKLSFAWNSGDDFTKENFKEVDPQRLIGSFSTLADLPDTSSEGYFAKVINLNAVYRYEEGVWVWFTDLFYPLSLGEGTTAISMEATPLLMHCDRSNPYNIITCPRISQEGSSFNLGKKEFGFHLAFFYGLINDELGGSYPFASSLQYGPTGETLGTYDLKLEGDAGLYENFLQEYYEFVMNRSRPVEYDKYFTASEIQVLNFIRKKRIFQHIFLLDEVSIPISNTSIGVATMKLQKI